tara:strand:- start:109 stop:378 length:270 start_codon:yes stop_codon:yes gene_type:complete
MYTPKSHIILGIRIMFGRVPSCFNGKAQEKRTNKTQLEKQKYRYFLRTLHHKFFDFPNGLCRIEMFRTGFGAIHDSVATVEFKGVLKFF